MFVTAVASELERWSQPSNGGLVVDACLELQLAPVLHTCNPIVIMSLYPWVFEQGV